MHYVLFCYKVNIHTRIYNSIQSQTRQKKYPVIGLLDSLLAFTDIYSLFKLEYNTVTE